MWCLVLAAVVHLVGYWGSDFETYSAPGTTVVGSELAAPPSADVSRVICFNVNEALQNSGVLPRCPREKMVLFMWEPPNVLHKMYKKEVTAHFSRIYTWHDDLVDNVQFFKFHYPVLRPMVESVVPFEEKKLCTLVARHLTCKRKNSLYKEREAAIAFFEKVDPHFAFYGHGWDPAKWKSYRGPVDDKIGTLRQYRFSICYENSRDLPGYITEKMFDCFAAGNVPIYWGASNIAAYVPSDCFIDRRDFATLEALYKRIQSMAEVEYNGYLERIRAYLKSDRAQLFSQEAFAKVFAEAAQMPPK